MSFCGGDLACCNVNLWILCKRNALNIVESQRGARRAVGVRSAEQCAQAVQGGQIFCLLRIAGMQRQSEAQRPHQYM